VSGEQIALVYDKRLVSAVPPSLLPRIVASLFKSGAIDKLSRQRIVTQSDVVLLLRKSGGADLRRMRLQQRGVAFVITLQRSRGDDEAVARAWRVRADKIKSQRNDWRVISVTNETLDAFLERPSLDALLKWCREHCKSVRAGVATCFPLELRERSDFWIAVCRVADVYKGRASVDVVVLYPGRETGGIVLPENNLADAVRHELVKIGKSVFYADRDHHGSFDENIAAAVVGCRRAVFVVSRVWFERKWCLVEMLLAIATGDDAKCKVIQFGDDFRAELLPLGQRVLRKRHDAEQLLSDEATRLAQWVQSSICK
jgi:hypothetical protein